MAALTPAVDRAAPLAVAVDTELAIGRSVLAPPGHKRNRELVGRTGLHRDLTLLAGVEGLESGGALLRESESAAARFWAADLARFSVAGSTFANHVTLLSAIPPGGEIVLSRLAHRSVLAGLVLGGQRPIWVMPESSWRDLIVAVVPDQRLSAAVRATGPGLRGVLVTEPTYAGRLGGIEATAAAAHERGIPLCVDQAWGAHFGLHPELPAQALRLGADVAVISLHKTLTAASQGALLLARRSDRLSLRAIDATFDLLTTTSPLSLIQTSLDRTRALVEARGEALLAKTLEGLCAVDGELEALRTVQVCSRRPGWDPTKLVLEMTAGHDGRVVARQLRRAGYQVAAADPDRLIAVVTLGDDLPTLRGLVKALGAVTRRPPERVPDRAVLSGPIPDPVVRLTPREAFLAPQLVVARSRAVGQVCAEAIAPYPPGVPVVMPGEVITEAVAEGLAEFAASGLRITGAADASLDTVRVVTGR